MTIITNKQIHWSFWLISGIALIWNGMGVLNFIGQMDTETVSQLPETPRKIIEVRPVWAFAAFGIAVFTGFLGSLMLLLKKLMAYPLLMVSLTAVIIQAIPYFGMDTKFSLLFILIMVLLQIGFSTFLIWYAKLAVGRRWIK